MDFLLFSIGIFDYPDGTWCPGFDFCGVDDNGSGRDAYYRPCPVLEIVDDINVGNAEGEPEEILLFRDFIEKFVKARQQDSLARELESKVLTGPKISQTYTEDPLLADIFTAQEEEQQEQEDTPTEDDNAGEEAEPVADTIETDDSAADSGENDGDEADASPSEDASDDDEENEPEADETNDQDNADDDCAGLPAWMCNN